MTQNLEHNAPLTSEEAERIRADFPLLSPDAEGNRLVYLDSGATAQKPQQVLDAEQNFYRNANAAVHRGAHRLAVEATDRFEAARRRVADFIGADEREVVWTSNATEALNLVAYSMSNATAGAQPGPEADRFRLQPGDEIVATGMEHHSNLIPWQELAARTGATFRYIPLTADARLDLDAAAELIGPKTRLVAFTHVSNVLGLVNDVDAIVALAREAGALTVLDACQSAPHLKLDVHRLGVDFAAFSGHKMLAPTGIGVLYGRAELLDAMPPVLFGGSMITTVTMDRAEFLPAPQRFEAGTQRVAQAVGLAAAIDYLDAVGMDRVATWEVALGRRLMEGIESLPGVRLLGPALDSGVERTGAVAFTVEGVHPHDVGQFLDARGIAIRVGHHCAEPLHGFLGVTASTRATSYLYNTEADIDAALNALADVRGFFGVAR
ncbi:aminotransferase class V-fold PLP-dependent enzyme [Citricoccus muralis]|uniref:Cysteine desulfurase n=1 Tax=Citricoccus muralis TaxID=169134 RepID=A0ABY8H989_9MICC|nr:SufS family cysteine desulfurase [Citricoccus muralis]WFP17719.1 SufS family cysteine desulfurase [Citricoccus muralis]